MNRIRIFSSIITGLLVLGLKVQAQETRGTPGVDYPNYDTIPKTSFSCSEQKYIPGFYADMETDCQVFHFCEENSQESFLCPTGTIFNQASLTCNSWDNCNCSTTPLFYSVNSGPEMENAVRSILMVLQLNKSRRPIISSPANVYEKIKSLYEGTAGKAQSKSPDLTLNINSQSNDGIKNELGSQEAREESEENESLTKDLYALDKGIKNQFPNRYNMDISEVQESEDMESNIFYDPVTEKYFVEYESSQAVNSNPEDTIEQFDSFDYDGFRKRYGLDYNEYVEMQSNSKSEDRNGSGDIQEFNDLLNAAQANEKELFKRLLDTERPARRVRRRPLYTIVQEDGVGISNVEGGDKYPVVDSANDRFTTELGLDNTEVNFELPEEISEDQMQEKLDSGVSFGILNELQNPDVATLNIPEVPRTSELEQVMLSGFASPETNEQGIGRYFLSEDEQRDEESLENISQVYPAGDEYSLIENASPDDYESYSAEYVEENSEVIGEQDSDYGTRDNEENINWYQGESFTAEDSMKSDDTYVVIPDEYDDGVLRQYSETNEEISSYDEQSDSTGSYEAWRDFLPSYVSPVVYGPVGPYWYPVPEYFPIEYGRQQPFASEDSFHPDLLRSSEYADSGAQSDEADQYGFAGPERYFPVSDSGSYAYETPSNFPSHVYGYDAENGYAYANVYGNPDISNFGYGVSDGKDSSESSVLNVDSDESITVNPEYSESDVQPWIQSDSIESSEYEEREATEISSEAFADMYATSRISSDLNLMPAETVDVPFNVNEDMNKDETFYLFDFDEDSEEKVKLDVADDVLETDMEQLGLKELFQTDEHLQPNESFEGNANHMNVGSQLESTSTQTSIKGEDFDQENAMSFDGSESAKSMIDSEVSQTAEDSRFNENADSLSALGNLEALNTARTPRLDASDINIFRDTYLNKMHPKSDFRSKGAVVMDQQYGMEDVPMTSNMENGFIARTGDTGLSRNSKLLEIQERIRSLKQGKFGAFKKYLSSAGDKNL